MASVPSFQISRRERLKVSKVEDRSSGSLGAPEPDSVVTTSLRPDGSIAATPIGDEPKQGRWLIFGIVATVMLMGSLDQTVVATALPTLHHALHSPINWVAWTITMYQLGLVLGMPVAGRLSDQFGRKRIFMTCIVLFAASSFACGTARSIGFLIFFRFFQAIGAAGFMPSASGIVADHFGRDRDRGLGLFLSIVPIGAFSGPLLGGTIIAYWSWRGVFLINLPIAVIAFVLALKFIPRTAPRHAPRADYLGIVLLATVILPMVLGITELGDGHVAAYSPRFLVPELIAVICGVVLVKHMMRVEQPIIPVRLLRNRAFATMNGVNMIYGGCVLGLGAMMPLYAEDRYHFIPLEAGSTISARSLGVLLCSGMATMMLRRVGYRKPMLLGYSIAAAGMFLIGWGEQFHISPYAWLVVSGGLMGIGAGIATPATNNSVLNMATGNIASISGLRGMFKQIGAMVSISIVSAFVTRSPHPGMELSRAFIIYSFIVVFVVLPLVSSVPDHKGTW